MTGLSDAERDASDVMRALAGLAALLRRQVDGGPGLEADGPEAGGPEAPGPEAPGPTAEDARRLLLTLAEDGGVAAARVLAYLREQRGAGDGDLAAVPPRLGPWREWVPPRGHLFGVVAPVRRANEVPQPRRCDPGE